MKFLRYLILLLALAAPASAADYVAGPGLSGGTAGPGWFTGNLPVFGNVDPYSKLAGQVGASGPIQARHGATPFISSMANATPLVAVGLTKMVTGYAGNAIRVTRASDSTTLDIPFLSDGIVDTNLMATFAGASTLSAAIFYDQLGNANNFTQATVANQCGIDMQTLRNGAPTIVCDFSHYFNIPAGVALTSTQNASAWVAMGQYTTRVAQVPFALGAGANCYFALSLTPQSAQAVQPFINGALLSMGSIQSVTNTNGEVVGLNSSASALTFYRNNYSVAIGPAASVAATGGGQAPSANIGSGGPGGSLTGANTDLYALVIYNAALIANDVALINYGLAQAYGMVTAPTANVVLIGDSITAGNGAGFPAYYWNYSRELYWYLGNKISIYTFGLGGQTLVSEAAEASVVTTPTFKAGIPNVFMLLGGVNDIASGTTAATMEASVITWAGQIHTAGGIAGIATLYPRHVTGGYTSAMETQRVLFNTWIRANSGYGKALDFDVDLELEPTFHPFWSAADSPDNLHPSIQAYKKVGPIFAAQLSNVLYGLTP